MRKLDLFWSCLNSALDRRYFFDKWIGDHSLVQLLTQDYNLEFICKTYLNKYINIVYLKDYKLYSKVIHKIKNYENNLTRATFYYFTKSSSIPWYFSTKSEWQEVYDNFRVLRTHSRQSNKRKVDLSTDRISLSTHSIELNLLSPSPPPITTNFRQRLTIRDIIGTNFFYTHAFSKDII